MWQIPDNFSLIDLGSDYFIAKLSAEEHLNKVLQESPWFINDYYLTVQKWVPNFVASKAIQDKLAIWLRLLQLATEFYDAIILGKIGNSIGRLLKVDACTSATLKGRYACLCVEIPLHTPVKSHIYVESHRQQIEYESKD